MSDQYTYGAEKTVAKTVQADLRDELRALGFDAFDARVTFDEARRNGVNADYFVEILSSHDMNHPVGGGAVAGSNVAVEVALVVGRVAAAVRVYDGHTLQRIDEFDLEKSNAALLPTGVGIGGRSVWAFLAIPFIQYGEYRTAAHEVARRAAERIAGR